tara:strand:- start:433 stop:1137 length:705 start_codon:yes stop_codon:yes gene_type:complete
MAANINSVYQKVLALLNKEQRGYLTPQEFNLLADRAQNEIYENYFHQIRNSNAKIKDDDTHTDTLEMIEAKLSPFLKSETNTNVSSGVMTLPTDLYKLDIVKVGTNLATEVNKKEEHYITSLGETGSVLYPKTVRPIFTRASSTTIRITPSPTDSSSCTINYYKVPTTPSWGYVVVNEKALYNVNTSVNFELAESEEEPLVSRILMLSGVVTKQQDAGQVGANAIQMTNQEQNS